MSQSDTHLKGSIPFEIWNKLVSFYDANGEVALTELPSTWNAQEIFLWEKLAVPIRGSENMRMDEITGGDKDAKLPSLNSDPSSFLHDIALSTFSEYQRPNEMNEFSYAEEVEGEMDAIASLGWDFDKCVRYSNYRTDDRNQKPYKDPKAAYIKEQSSLEDSLEKAYGEIFEIPSFESEYKFQKLQEIEHNEKEHKITLQEIVREFSLQPVFVPTQEQEKEKKAVYKEPKTGLFVEFFQTLDPETQEYDELHPLIKVLTSTNHEILEKILD